MKSLVLLTGCKGSQIKKYFKLNEEFTKTYNVFVVNLLYYLINKHEKMDDKDNNNIINADVIIRMTSSNKTFLSMETLKSMCKESCIIINIPHYTTTIYSADLIDDCIEKKKLMQYETAKKFDSFENIIDKKKLIIESVKKINSKIYTKDYCIKKINDCIEVIKKQDLESDVKMANFFINNYMNHRLFFSDYYPTSMFMFEMTNQILNILKFDKNDFELCKNDNWALNTFVPINNSYYEAFNFKFENKNYIHPCIELSIEEWYYVGYVLKNFGIEYDNTKNITDIILEFKNS